MPAPPRRPSPPRPTGRRARTPLRIETLENRDLPSTLTVTNLSDHDPGSLRDELAQAQAGDTVNFAPDLAGTILLDSGELRIDQSLTISGPGADQITVSGGNGSRVFEIAAGSEVAIEGLTITGGHLVLAGAGTGVGAGIANYGRLTLTDCDVVGNAITGSSSALALGTGIYNAGDLTLTGGSVSRNSAAVDSSQGGGLWNGTGSLTLMACTVSGNSAGGIGGGAGGGVFNAGGTVTVTDCTVTGNTTSRPSGAGGGIDNGAGNLAVVDSILSDNIAAEGAGIDNAGTLLLTGSTLVQNHSSFSGGAGGGLYNTGRAELFNCTVTDNSQTGNGGAGGGMYDDTAGVLVLTACTVSGNTALDRYDGVGGLESAGTTRLRNTIVAGNHSGAGKPDVFGTFDSQGYNLIGVADGSTGWNGSDLVGSAASPLDPGLGVLGDYGGPTPTIPLSAGSPALDAGDPALLGAPDQRGVARGGGVNIGAFQATATFFILDAPAEVTAGVPFDVTVTAYDPYGNVAVGYTGTVNLYSTDPQAAYLGSYSFTLADGGTYVFADVTLATAGPQTLVAGDGPLVGLFNLMVVPGQASRTRRATILDGVAASLFAHRLDAVLSGEEIFAAS